MRVLKGNINLYDTLFSGQCFRVFLEDDASYTIILSDRVINVKESDEYLVIESNKEENLESIVKSYFDLNRDYDKINEFLSKRSEIIKNNIHLCEGYKILRQDKFEMFITYIISQNNNVKRIAGSVNKISEAYGKKVIFKNKEYYLFPTFDELKNVTAQELRNFGVGFRDKYIINALNKLKSDEMFLDNLYKMNTSDALNELTSITGIGMKVASCILLFGYGKTDTYPVDTWVRHFVSENFNIKDDIKAISKFMNETFSEYSGVAIQYFYHIERNKKNKN